MYGWSVSVNDSLLWTTADSTLTLSNGMPAHFAQSAEYEAVYKILSISQPAPAPETIAKTFRPSNVVEKAQLNSRLVWFHENVWMCSLLFLCIRLVVVVRKWSAVQRFCRTIQLIKHKHKVRHALNYIVPLKPWTCWLNWLTDINRPHGQLIYAS